MLYRVFPFLAASAPTQPGGPLYVPRDRQGAGRHDHPESYGVMYLSRSVESAIAERIQGFRGQALASADLRLVNGARFGVATFEDEELDGLLDLDDPNELVRRTLRPSVVATRDRAITRDIALRIFREGSSGFAWWSTLESSWTNVTLFAERAVDRLVLIGRPEPVTLDHPALRSAAETIGVRLLG